MPDVTKRKIVETLTREQIVITISPEEAEALNGILAYQISAGDPEYDEFASRLRTAISDAPVSVETVDERPIRVGDRVRVTSAQYDAFVGGEGVVIAVDPDDERLPYKVELGPYTREWVRAVERV